MIGLQWQWQWLTHRRGSKSKATPQGAQEKHKLSLGHSCSSESHLVISIFSFSIFRLTVPDIRWCHRYLVLKSWEQPMSASATASVNKVSLGPWEDRWELLAIWPYLERNGQKDKKTNDKSHLVHGKKDGNYWWFCHITPWVPSHCESGLNHDERYFGQDDQDGNNDYDWCWYWWHKKDVDLLEAREGLLEVWGEEYRSSGCFELWAWTSIKW